MALAALGPFALAQELAPSPGKPVWVQSIPIWLYSWEWAACWGYESAAVERLFGETEGPTRGFEKRVQTIRVGADGRAFGGQPSAIAPCVIPWTTKRDFRAFQPMHDGR
jgi:hypothetical protein